MTERRARLQRRREIKRRNMEKMLFRNAVKFLVVALVEIAAGGLVLLMNNDQWMVNAWQMVFIYVVGVTAAFLLWKD
jgi:hypothetical protein